MCVCVEGGNWLKLHLRVLFLVVAGEREEIKSNIEGKKYACEPRSEI